MNKSYIEQRYQRHLKLLDALDQAIHSEVWGNRNFLKALKSQLEAIREKFNRELKLDGDYITHYESKLFNKDKSHAGEIKVYISLYNTDGRDLGKWTKLILNLVNKIITRPVYRVEEDIRTLIRAKENPTNEGYVVAYINNNALIPPADEKPPTDRFGNELLLIRDGSIQLDNIFEFIHLGTRYKLKYGRLISEDQSNTISS